MWTTQFCMSRFEEKPFFLSKFTLKLDSLSNSEYQDYLMRWMSLVLDYENVNHDIGEGTTNE